MTFKDQMIADADALFNTDELAEWITYQGARIRAIFVAGEEKTRGNTFTSEGYSDRAILHVLARDVTPESGDSFFREDDLSITWRVARVLNHEGGVYRLECEANPNPFGR